MWKGRFVAVGWIALVALISGSAIAKENSALSDDAIAQILIDRSINSYSGNCPCPYNRASNGSRCGGRSAYSRPGGASPLCYREDVSADSIKRYRAQHQIADGSANH